MTIGAVIFAVNNDTIDYVSMAAWNAQNIRRHLGLPVCLISDQLDSRFDQVITIDTGASTPSQRYFEDFDKNVEWHNQTRCDVFDLSPWDQTLVLDADYVVASSQLRVLFDCSSDFTCYDRAWDVMTGHLCDELNHYGRYRIPMAWATVMMFRKTSVTHQLFQCMSMVRDNWLHYRDLYDFGRSRYRNDYALSIALNIMSGHTMKYNAIPWKLMTALPSTRLDKIGQDQYRFEKSNRYVTLSDTDFHAMGKKHLGEAIAGNS